MAEDLEIDPRKGLTLAIVLVYLAVTAILALAPIVFGYPPKESIEVLKIYLAAASGPVSAVLGYWFGSRGARKTAVRRQGAKGA